MILWWGGHFSLSPPLFSSVRSLVVNRHSPSSHDYVRSRWFSIRFLLSSASTLLSFVITLVHVYSRLPYDIHIFLSLIREHTAVVCWCKFCLRTKCRDFHSFLFQYYILSSFSLSHAWFRRNTDIVERSDTLATGFSPSSSFSLIIGLLDQCILGNIRAK